MNKVTKILFLACILNAVVLVSFADRGVSKKAKSKVALNINSSSNFKSNLSFNLKTGLKYKGSFVASTTKAAPTTIVQNSFATYQKGNSLYVIPYKQKVVVPEVRQGYTGMKIIIKTP